VTFFDYAVLFLSFCSFWILRLSRNIGLIFTLYGSNDVFPQETDYWDEDNRWRYLWKCSIKK